MSRVGRYTDWLLSAVARAQVGTRGSAVAPAHDASHAPLDAELVEFSRADAITQSSRGCVKRNHEDRQATRPLLLICGVFDPEVQAPRRCWKQNAAVLFGMQISDISDISDIMEERRISPAYLPEP